MTTALDRQQCTKELRSRSTCAAWRAVTAGPGSVPRSAQPVARLRAELVFDMPECANMRRGIAILVMG
jgi:hypothetical protein